MSNKPLSTPPKQTTRNVAVAKKSAQKVIDEAERTAQFLYLRNLLRNVAYYVQHHGITHNHWENIKSKLLVDAAFVYTPQQQEQLTQTVEALDRGIKNSAITNLQAPDAVDFELYDNNNKNNNNQVSNININKTTNSDDEDHTQEIGALFEGAKVRGVINDTQLKYFRDLLSGKEQKHAQEETSEDAALQEMGAIYNALGTDFSFKSPDYEELHADNISHKCIVTCVPFENQAITTKSDMFVEVQFKFKVEYPKMAPFIDFVDSRGITTGSLVVLKSMLDAKAESFATRNKVVVMELVELTRSYLTDEAVATAVAAAKDAKRPTLRMPNKVNYHDLNPMTNGTETKNFELQDLVDLCLNAATDRIKQASGDRCQIFSSDNVISPTLFKNFKAKLADFYTQFDAKTNANTMYYPVVAFHGTLGENHDSIVDGGLLQAGEFTKDGTIIQSTNGHLYGKGIYTTPQIEIAHWYGAHDGVGFSQIFVTLVAMGASKRLTDKDMAPPAHNEKFKIYVPDMTAPFPGYDSQVSPLGEKYVVFDTHQVLPVLLITYGPKYKPDLDKHRFNIKLDMSGPPMPSKKSAVSALQLLSASERKTQHAINKQNTNSNKIKFQNRKFIEIEPEKKTADDVRNPEKTNEGFVMYKIPGGNHKWMMNLSADKLDILETNYPNLLTLSGQTETHLIFLLDKSASMGSTFSKLALPGCAQVYRAVAPDKCSMVLFGKTTDLHSNITNGHFFDDAKLKATKLEDGTNFLAGYKTAMDLAFLNKENMERSEENTIFDKNIKVIEKAADKIVDHMDQKNEAKAERILNKLIETDLKTKTDKLFLFVMMTDGEDTENNDDKFDEVLTMYNKMITGSRMKSVFKVVGIGKESDTKLAMRMKLATDSIKLWESTPYYQVGKVNMLAHTMKQLSDDLKGAITLGASLDLRLTDTPYLDGFISNLTHPPKQDIQIKIHPTKKTTIMFTGVPPRSIDTGYWMQIPVYLVEKPKYESLQIQAALLELLTSLISDIKVAIVAGRDVEKNVIEVRDIVKAIKEATFNEKEVRREGVTPQKRINMMHKKRRLISELEEMLNGLEDILIQGKSLMKASSIHQAVWLNKAESMKYGAKALRRSALVKRDVKSILTSLEKITDDYNAGKFTSKPEDPCSEISGLNAYGHVKEIATSPTLTPSNLDIIDLLYAYGMVGVGIRVQRSEASNIDPWKLAVNYVSSDYWDTAGAMCLLHAKGTHKDSLGNIVGDVLVLADPRNPAPYYAYLQSPLNEAYMGVIFTRNPDVQLPQHRTTLLIVSLVKAITQLLDPEFRTRKFVATLFSILYTVRRRCGVNGTSNKVGEYWSNIINKLLLQQPGRWMTEAPEDGIGSVSKILGTMCSFNETTSHSGLFEPKNKKQLAEVSLALLAETSSRGIRKNIKTQILKIKADNLANPDAPVALPTKKDIAHKLLMVGLGITPESSNHPDPDLSVVDNPVTHSGKYDLDRAKKKSNVFFYKEKTGTHNNCPPQAVLACLTFAEAMCAQYSNIDEILEHGSEADVNKLYDHIIKEFEGVSMSKFLAKFVVADDIEPPNPIHLQIAIYTQGLKYHSSQTRRAGLASLITPEPVITNLATDTRAAQYLIELDAKNKEVRKRNAGDKHLMRQAESIAKQQAFMYQHPGLPKIFTHNEVATLNLTRPADDQLEVLPSGLLKHHCCWPTCDKYLVNLATPRDKALNRRGGIHKHLSLFTIPQNWYVKSFHTVAYSHYKRNQNISLEDFRKFMQHNCNFPSHVILETYTLELYRNLKALPI